MNVLSSFIFSVQSFLKLNGNELDGCENILRNGKNIFRLKESGHAPSLRDEIKLLTPIIFLLTFF